MNGNGTHDVYQMVTDRILAQLEKGTVPWHKPWSTETGGIPRSMSTGKSYRGINTWLLLMTSMDEGYASPWWGTFHRIKELGGKIRKGQHGTRVVWWKTITKPDPNDPEKKISFMIGKTDVVFNSAQADWPDGIPEKYKTEEIEPTEIAELPEPEAVLREYIATRGPELVYAKQGRAYYQPGPDVITLPTREQFDSAEEFYSTALHEASHSTGNKKRLNRPGITEWTGFGSHGYGIEELISEFSASFLCATCGITSTQENSAAYLHGWMKAIREDIKMVSKAATQAQAAADYILGIESEETEESKRELVNA